MTGLRFFTVDVFTEEPFGGNPLAVVMGGDGLDDARMLAIAREFNLSETAFVLPSVDPSNFARIWIFNRAGEMPFAGHPMVGTGFVLGLLRPELDAAIFEVPAGLVHVRIDRDCTGAARGAEIDAPAPLTIGPDFRPADIAAAIGLSTQDVVTDTHPPMLVSTGNGFVVVEVSERALPRCVADPVGFREILSALPAADGRLSLYVYAWKGADIRARMFAPLSGTWEDPATGSAATALASLLLSLEPSLDVAQLTVRQGLEMGRPSLLRLHARRSLSGIVASVAGSCVSVMQGHFT